MRPLYHFLLLLTPVFSFVQERPMSTSEIEAFKKEWVTEMEAMKSLEANFIQTKHFEFIDEVSETNGTLYYNAPSAIRWEYKAPGQQSIIRMNKDYMHTQDENTSNLVAFNKNSRLRELSKLIHNGMTSDQIFDSQHSHVDYYKTRQGYRVVLRPNNRQAARFIKHIELEITEQPWHVKNIKIVQPTNDYTVIKFNDVKKNVSLSPGLFSFN